MREGVDGALHRSHRGAAPAHRSAGPLCETDRLEVWKFDRLARDLCHRIDLGTDLKKHGCQLASITEVIDTTTPGASWCSPCSARWPSLKRASTASAPCRTVLCTPGRRETTATTSNQCSAVSDVWDRCRGTIGEV